MKFALLFAAVAATLVAQAVADVRKAAQAGDFAAAEDALKQHKGTGIWTPELVLAQSWLGRAAQANKKWDQAIAYSTETRRLALDLLKHREIDDEKDLPLALGASIEVHGHALANTGRRSEGVAFLKDELKRWNRTSMRTRIQKNLHLLALEGQRPPRLETAHFLGATKIKSLDEFKGKPVLLFLWAHWCADCKAQGPILEALRKDFPHLAIVAPTQHYGYVANGEDALPLKEFPYIAKVQKEHYGWMSDLPMPVSEENFRNYGVSSTPTLVLLDAQGLVRNYHPGKMTAEELRQALAALPK